MAALEVASIGIDLSEPVRIVAFDSGSGEVVQAITAKARFEPGSRQGYRQLAKEIREFSKPLAKKRTGTAGLSMSDCLLFTVAMPKLSKKEFTKAIQYEIERLAPGGTDTMRAVVEEWPAQLPVPPAVKVPEGTTLYLVAAAQAEAVLAAHSLMKAAGLRPLGVDVPANAVSKASLWLWEQAKLSGVGTETSELQANSLAAKSESASSTTTGEAAAYTPWITHGNGGNSAPLADDPDVAATSSVDNEQAGAEGAPERTGPGTALDISIVANASEALMYLSYGSCPWLSREIPLDPDNPFVNGQILAGEITRSARFARASANALVDARVTVIGESDRVSFLADYLKEQTGLPTRLWGSPVVRSDPEYGVAVGLALLHQGGAKS